MGFADGNHRPSVEARNCLQALAPQRSSLSSLSLCGPLSVLQRFATPGEVAAMVAPACSAQASATTGAALQRTDGAVVRSIA